MLDKESSADPRGVCVERKCPQFGKVWYRGQCEDTDIRRVCPRYQELLTNPFGKGGFLR